MNSRSTSAVLDQALDPVTECFTPDVARRVAALRASSAVQVRLDELAEKSNEGTISAEERAEYEAWVRTINFIGVLQAKARKIVFANGSS